MRAPLSRLPDIFARGGRVLAEATVHAQRSLAWMAQRACMDSLHVYDNGGHTPRHVAAFEYGPPTLFADSNSIRCALVNERNASDSVRDDTLSCARATDSVCCLPDAGDALATHACGWSNLKQRMSAQCSRLE